MSGSRGDGHVGSGQAPTGRAVAIAGSGSTAGAPLSASSKWTRLRRLHRRRHAILWGRSERLARRALRDRALAVEPHVVRGLRWFPRSRFLLMLHALAAEGSGRFALAVERWTLVSRALPDLAMPYCRVSANHRHSAVFHLANEVMEQAARLFPDDLETMIELAVVSIPFGNLPRAADCWIKAVDLSGGDALCTSGAAQTLLLLGRFEEAQAFVDAGRERHPNDRNLAAAEAMLAASREDWPAAVSLWSAFHDRYPDDVTGWEHLGRAVAASRLAGIVDPGPSPAIEQAVGDRETMNLLLRFQSIGDNCEFGLVQRRFGAEPLGLLRWNSVKLQNLVAALEEGFAGMGEAENVELEVLGNRSYFARDRRWDLGMHTFQFVGQIDQATLHARMCRRVAYLRDKFLADLAEGQTTLVYRSDTASGDDAATLLRALRRHGPARLLVVSGASGVETPGKVRLLESGCWLGSTRRPGVAQDKTWDIPFDDWLDLCRAVPA